MMLVKKICGFITIILILTASLTAKEELNDSLVRIINSTTVDTIKIEAFLELAKITQTSKPDQSVDITINALEIAENLMNERLMAKSYNQLGVSYYHKGELIHSKNFINNAYQLYKKLNDKQGIGTTLNGLGVLYYDQGELQQALEYFNNSLTYKNEINDVYGSAMSLNNIGNVYKDLGEYEKAIVYYNNSIELKRKIDDQLGIAMSFNNIGLVHHHLKNYEKALIYYQNSIEIKQKLNDKYGEAMTLHNIGWLYQVQENYAAAMKNYQMALDMREIIGDNYGSSMTLGNMSEVQTKLENFDKAIFYLNISLLKAQQIKATKLLKDIYLQLSSTQVLANDFENAYFNQKKYINFTDSLMGEDRFKELSVLKAEMEAKNAASDVNLLLKERQIQKLKNKRQEIISYALAVCIILLLILGIVLFLRNKDKLKHFALQEQLNEISKITNSYIVISDSNDKITWVNEDFIKIFGYSFNEIIGKTPREILRGKDTDKNVIAYIEKKVSLKEPFNTEILNYTKDGTPIWLSISTAVIKKDNNEVDRYVSFGSDITARKNAEKEIKRILS